MLYYHVWVRSVQYRGSEALTYHHAAPLAVGAIVEVPLRERNVLGIVIESVPKPSFTTKQITNVVGLPPLPGEIPRLAEWLREFYSTPVGVVTGQFLPQVVHIRYMANIIKLCGDGAAASLSKQPPLTEEQRIALDVIQQPDTYLLHGRTGSGKTRIYLELASRALAAGRSVLVLSPEIGLTSQLAAAFRTAFGQRVMILHSRLTSKDRETVWLSILATSEPLVIIGPRSALFSPLRQLGLIIIDEAHDPAYKQEQAPYYHALRVAAQLRALHHATLVLGSATPSVTDYYLAQKRSKAIIRLKHVAVATKHEQSITIVDLRDRRQFPRTPHLSLALISAITGSLGRHEQALLYLNRRGTARVALCPLCGWQALCPHCGLPLTYHGDDFRLRCHICGYQQPAQSMCPSCGNTSLAYHSFGTKAIVEEVKRVFPEARVQRFDTDNRQAERLERQYDQILEGNVDILVGTQLLAKGLDLPRLSTLGVILADSSLYIPDYTAHERTYQLLTQVIGRVGRGHRRSQAVVQTYDPDSELLQAALADDWETFYNNEINERQRYLLPPFSHLLKLICQRQSALGAEKAATALKTKIMLQHPRLRIEGPAPAFREKSGHKYNWQLIVKSQNRPELLSLVSELPAGWSYDIDPANLL